MTNKKEDKTNIKEKVGYGVLGIMLWCSTGGLMFVHAISWFLGYSSVLLAIIGLFIPPVGLINGFIFILTGDSLEQYF